ncbi:hypothetical protein J1N35_009151 [Gossypium stocksii]|uniref:tRNA (adenine(58)-N(1))-methyltransferase n=1 Tax=Gossypium stocksii TaxID=47602 RepID=A0A9D3VZP0_9ROSI|nr:hypothetical protein J1N35_009151 [Gossypium stocksii]
MLKQDENLCSFSPCIEQVQRSCETLRSDFTDIWTFEILLHMYEIREWKTDHSKLLCNDVPKKHNCYSRILKSHPSSDCDFRRTQLNMQDCRQWVKSRIEDRGAKPCEFSQTAPPHNPRHSVSNTTFSDKLWFSP